MKRLAAVRGALLCEPVSLPLTSSLKRARRRLAIGSWLALTTVASCGRFGYDTVDSGSGSASGKGGGSNAFTQIDCVNPNAGVSDGGAGGAGGPAGAAGDTGCPSECL